MSLAINGNDLGLSGYLDIGIYDTMKDLFVNFIGAFVFSIIGYFYVKTRGKHSFAKHFIPTIAHNRAELLNERTKENEDNKK